MKVKFVIFIPVLLAILFNGCSLFTSRYDSIRHENFTRLKAVHVKLFDNWSEGSNKTWIKNEVLDYCDKGDLKFREAFEYAKSKDNKDKTGQKSVKILWDEFSSNCKLSLKKQKLFSSDFKDQILPEIVKNYEYAIDGELSRVKALK